MYRHTPPKANAGDCDDARGDVGALADRVRTVRFFSFPRRVDLDYDV